MNPQSSTVSLAQPDHPRRPSVSSRFSYAVSTAERGENRNAPANNQIEEEIAEIKRYEVCFCAAAIAITTLSGSSADIISI